MKTVLPSELPTTLHSPATESYKPFTHAMGRDLTIQALTSINPRLAPISERHELSNNGARHVAWYEVDLSPILSGVSPSGFRYDLVTRNATDRSSSWTVFLGENVFICSNGLVLGVEAKARRRHTSGCSPEEVCRIIHDTLNATPRTVRSRVSEVEALRTSEVTTPEKTAVELARQGVISSQDIIPVLDYYEDPESMTAEGYDGTIDPASFYVPRSRFCFFNAVTARLRDKGPFSDSPERHRRLRHFFSPPTPAAPPAPIGPLGQLAQGIDPTYDPATPDSLPEAGNPEGE